MHFRHVKVLPYVGPEYDKTKPWKLSVLIVGESHYLNEPLYETVTSEIVHQVIDGANYRFFTKVAGLFYGKWPDHAVRRVFWKSVAFYNFIQETAGETPRVRPTDQMWRDGIPAFEEVLGHLKPEFVVVLGADLWRHLPNPSERGLVRLDGRSRESRLYTNNAGVTFAFGINHPASGGWSYRLWTPWLKEALETAVRWRDSASPPRR